MKKTFLLLGAMALTGLMAPKASAQGYELRILTFEDSDLGASFSGDVTDGGVSVGTWSNLIDDEQYNGFLYNGTAYYWHDGGLTELYHTCALPFWGGGHAISNYACNDYTTNGEYTDQLTVYQSSASGLVRIGGGHNGSDNFAIHFGYKDESGYGTDGRQTLEFADGVERVIDHIYVNNTTYVLNQYLSGGGFNPPAEADDWFRISATGYDVENQETGTIYFYLCQGNELGNGVIDDWTKWDMSELGAIVKVVFDMQASENMIGSYGMNVPAYFAYDDVAVRFPVSTPAEPTSYERTGLTVGNYGTICMPYAVNAGAYTGATFYEAVGQTADGIVMEEATGNLVAGKAYIFQATATSLNCTYTGEKANTPMSAAMNNGLQGVYEDNTDVPANMYFLNGNKLWKSTGANKVDANRAYIDLTYVPAGVPAPVAGRRRVVVPCMPEQTTGLSDATEAGEQVTKQMINGKLYIIKGGRVYDAQGKNVQ